MDENNNFIVLGQLYELVYDSMTAGSDEISFDYSRNNQNLNRFINRLPAAVSRTFGRKSHPIRASWQPERFCASPMDCWPNGKCY